MKTAEAIAWFKRTFGERIAAAVEGTPFSVDLMAAIANQETGYIWAGLVAKGLPESDILRLCVGDTLDADRGRSCFPRHKAELMAAPRGGEMFKIAREALLEMGQHVAGYESAIRNPDKFCHGYGIFQYDLQFFKENPAFFLQKSWGDFDLCLAQGIDELKQAAGRQGWRGRTTLSDEQKVYAAIAYNAGSADCTRGFKQGHKSDGRCYGENIYEFLRIAQGIPLRGMIPLPARPVPARSKEVPVAAPAVAFKKRGVIFEVVVQEGPLRLRSEPLIRTNDPASNVLARLPKGQLVQRVSSRKRGEFLEVETIWNGTELRGFASAKYLRQVKRAIAVKPSRTTRGARPAVLRETEAVNNQQQKGKGGASSRFPVETVSALVATMDIETLIRAVQKELGIGVDGRAGTETWKAIYFRVMGKKPDAATPPRLPAAATGTVDARSEKTIATLQPEVRPYARALVLKAASIGITIKVISGLRSYAEQNELYAQGRSTSGKVVTNAKGGYSNHNFGIAFDIGIFDGASYIPESPRYKAVGALGVELGLEWGGNWKTIKDEPHFQLRPKWAGDRPEKEMLAELRERAASGRGFYA